MSPGHGFGSRGDPDLLKGAGGGRLGVNLGRRTPSPYPLPGGERGFAERYARRSKRSAFMTLVQAAAKSFTNFSPASSAA